MTVLLMSPWYVGARQGNIRGTPGGWKRARKAEILGGVAAMQHHFAQLESRPPTNWADGLNSLTKRKCRFAPIQHRIFIRIRINCPARGSCRRVKIGTRHDVKPRAKSRAPGSEFQILREACELHHGTA